MNVVGVIFVVFGNVLLWFYCLFVGFGIEGLCEKDNWVEIGDLFGFFWYDVL